MNGYRQWLDIIVSTQMSYNSESSVRSDVEEQTAGAISIEVERDFAV